MMLIDNAFAVLGAMPGDDQTIVRERAKQAAESGRDVDAALNQLTQMEQRLQTELTWLPGASPQSASAFLAYAQGISEGREVSIPPVEALGTALAQANALSPLFERWPTDEPEMLTALCLAMDGILGQITVEETFQAINADRRRGGWPELQDAGELTQCLNEHLRALCAPAKRGIENLPFEKMGETIGKLLGPEGIDYKGILSQVINESYTTAFQNKANAMSTDILKNIKKLSEARSVSDYELDSLQNTINEWCSLVGQLPDDRQSSNVHSLIMVMGFRNVLVNYVNNSRSREKKYTNYDYLPITGKTMTITYQSKSDYVNKALALLDWLEKQFPEQTKLDTRLENDRKQLKDILSKETDMLQNAAMTAHIQGKL